MTVSGVTPQADQTPIHSVTVSKQAQQRPNVVLKDAKEDGKHKTPTVLEVHNPPYLVSWRISSLSRARDNQPHPFSVEKRLLLLCLRQEEGQCWPLTLSQFVSLDLLGLPVSAVFEPSHFSSTSFRAVKTLTFACQSFKSAVSFL